MSAGTAAQVPQIHVVPVSVPATPTRPAARRTGRVRLQIDPAASFGTISGPLAAGLGVLTIGSLGHDVWQFAPQYGFYGAGVMAVFSVIAAKARHYTPAALIYRVAAFMLAGLWLFAAWTWTPWSAGPLITLGLVASGMGTIHFVARTRRTAAELEAARLAAAQQLHERDARALDWAQRIERVGGGKQFEGVRIAAISDWKDENERPTGDGFTIDGDCPPGGTNWRDLAAITTDLAADARLKPGCDIEAHQGEHQGAFLLHIPTRDTFAEYQLTDDPIVPATVLNGVDLGPTRTRTRAIIPIRESSTAIVSEAGGGKTTLLHRFVLRIAMCTDGLTPIIDMNNGAMGVAWCDAWWDGEAPYPVVPAIAGDAAEAFLLTRFLVGVALGRKRRSGPLKMKANQSLMPIGNGAPGEPPPGIFPIYDESAELVGADASGDDISGLTEEQQAELIKKTMAAAEKVLRVARDAGIRPVFSSLRATDDFLPTSLLALCKNRLGLHLATDADHGVLFGWTKGEKSESTEPRKGVGRYSLGHNLPTTAFAAPDMTPQQIREYSIRIAEAGIGPYDLTEEDIVDGEAYAGEGVWTRRWERAEKLFGRPRTEFGTGVALPAPAVVVMAREEDEPAGEPTPAATGGSMSDLNRGLDEIQAQIDAVLAGDGPAPVPYEQTEVMPEPMDAEVADEADAAQLAKLYELWALPSVDPARQQEEPVAAAWQDRLLQLLDVVEGGGASPTALADQLKKEGRSTTRQTVQDWCTEESKRQGGPVVKLKRGTYALRKHVPDAER